MATVVPTTALVVMLILVGCAEDDCAFDTDCPLYQRCEARQCIALGNPDTEPRDASATEAGPGDAGGGGDGAMDAAIPPDSGAPGEDGGDPRADGAAIDAPPTDSATDDGGPIDSGATITTEPIDSGP